MPYVLTPIIQADSPGMWMEGHAYERRSIYSITENKLPPVNYDEHILRPHSLTHIETPAHVEDNGQRLEFYYKNNINFFYGPTTVIRLPGNNYKKVQEGIYHWEIQKEEILIQLKKLHLSNFPTKLLITSDFYPLNKQGYHDPNYVLTLSQSAADFLVSHTHFNLYGTSWKSSDYMPGRAERPIHKTLFKKALILENLELQNVPEGTYFMTAFPLPLDKSSESPVVPVLFRKEEILGLV